MGNIEYSMCGVKTTASEIAVMITNETRSSPERFPIEDSFGNEGKMNFKIVLMWFACSVAWMFPQAAWSYEKLGIVQYTPPAGWTKTSKPNVVGFSKLNQATGKYCILTVYGATAGTGNARQDFRREWKNLVIKNMKADANPKTQTEKDGAWTAIAGGSQVELETGKAVGVLTVLSGYNRTISVLAVFNDQVFTKPVSTFIDSIKLDKIVAPPKPVAPQPVMKNGRYVIPNLTRTLSLADLVGVWNENPDRVSTTYVDRSSGAYVGTDSLHYTSEMRVAKNGVYTNNYFAIRNGAKESDTTKGMLSISGHVVSLKRRVNAQRTTTTRMVVIGWLELPHMTLMKVSSNFFEGNVIPQKLLVNPDPSDYSGIWVRKK